MLFAEAYGRDLEKSEDIMYIAGLTEIIHNGTLVVDDIEDSSLMRRS